ncbi:hypothetical protein F0919_12110 [Taibaiella lutea]|uniref:Uncharacterized protein n=1 Tax=Taibaiella lutea TaxID=2608001 RepID=A0A5M6CIQ9_9BACT|nr:hypothetical protein F0919_12110 [Taibaiella lutea]
MTIYRDCVLQESKNGDAYCGAWSSVTMQDIGDLFLGRNFTGKLDDAILFNKEINQREVNNLFTMGNCCL